MDLHYGKAKLLIKFLIISSKLDTKKKNEDRGQARLPIFNWISKRT